MEWNWSIVLYCIDCACHESMDTTEAAHSHSRPQQGGNNTFTRKDWEDALRSLESKTLLIAHSGSAPLDQTVLTSILHQSFPNPALSKEVGAIQFTGLNWICRREAACWCY